MCSQYVSAICRSLCGGLFVLIRLCAGCHPVTRAHPLCRPCTGLGRHTGPGPSRRRRTDMQAVQGGGGTALSWRRQRKVATWEEGQMRPRLNKAPPTPDKHHYQTWGRRKPMHPTHSPSTSDHAEDGLLDHTALDTQAARLPNPLSNINQSINREKCLGEISPKY